MNILNVDWDADQILIVTIDIEVDIENGFPNETKDHYYQLLKNHQNKRIVVWGMVTLKMVVTMFRISSARQRNIYTIFSDVLGTT